MVSTLLLLQIPNLTYPIIKYCYKHMFMQSNVEINFHPSLDNLGSG